jgi:gliding motility-associated-like protein
MRILFLVFFVSVMFFCSGLNAATPAKTSNLSDIEDTLYNFFSPNGDSLNQFFKVYLVSQYPENKLFIFNRWGDLVFKAEPYDNTWTGLSTNGDVLPEGVYFYRFEYALISEGKTASISSKLILKR